MVKRLRERQEWQFFALLPKAAPGLTVAWWSLLLLAGILPAVFAVATGVMVHAVQRGDSLFGALVLVGVAFIAMLVVSPILTAVSMNLGNQVSAWLERAADRELRRPARHRAPGGCRPGRGPDRRPGVRPGHDRPADVLQRRLHRHQPGRYWSAGSPPRSCWSASPGGRRWSWSLAWASTHWLLRESGVWKDRNTPAVRSAQRRCGLRLPAGGRPSAGQGAAAVRAGAAGLWSASSSAAVLFDLQYRATRLRERSVLWCW